MARRWCIHPHDAERISGLARAAGIPAVVAQLLLTRDIADPTAATDFLAGRLSSLRDPELLPGCCQAAQRIHEAIRAGKRVTIHGDYDVDGMTGTSILWLCLRLLGANVGYYVPHRLEEGYGLSADTVRLLASQKSELIVTVDCGIASVDEAEVAAELGVELIVTDHHEPPTRLPSAAAIVHPRLPGQAYPFGGLSGSGVALKLAWALCQQASGARRVNPNMKDFLLQAVGLAAMGTVADVVPLLDENRVLVKHGLISLAQRPTVGMKALLSVAKLDSKKALDSEDVAFNLAPRLNAAGRLGQPLLAVELLTTDRVDRAEALATYLDQLNANRQTLERSIYLAANRQVKEHFDADGMPALVLADRGWHAGVIGIVAGRLSEKYHRPVVLISWDQMGVRPGIGSARSVPGFNLHAALAACGEHLVAHGGHAAAAGLKIDEANLERFRNDFCDYVAAEIRPEQCEGLLEIDAEVPLSVLVLEAVQQLEQLAPFGSGNPRPCLCATGCRLAEPPRAIGADQRHLALRVEQHGISLRGVAFGQVEWIPDLEACEGPIDIAFRPVINAFRGKRSVEMQVVDWRRSTLGP